jgi:hypothetical protein
LEGLGRGWAAAASRRQWGDEIDADEISGEYYGGGSGWQLQHACIGQIAGEKKGRSVESSRGMAGERGTGGNERALLPPVATSSAEVGRRRRRPIQRESPAGRRSGVGAVMEASIVVVGNGVEDRANVQPRQGRGLTFGARADGRLAVARHRNKSGDALRISKGGRTRRAGGVGGHRPNHTVSASRVTRSD